MNQRKHERQVQAAVAAMEKRLRQVYALTNALLRAEVLLEGWARAGRSLSESGQSEDEIIEAGRRGMELVEITPMLRLETMLSVHLAMLHAVVEKWRQWKFSDADVDRLLSHRFTDLLEAHRHAIVHADDIEDPGREAALQESALLGWAFELSAALANHLRLWHRDPEGQMREFLTSKGFR